jgi:DNA mismatch repair ATPase MutS
MRLVRLRAGLNVARMAELPEAVVVRAGARAAAMEAETLRRLSRRVRAPCAARPWDYVTSACCAVRL